MYTARSFDEQDFEFPGTLKALQRFARIGPFQVPQHFTEFTWTTLICSRRLIAGQRSSYKGSQVQLYWLYGLSTRNGGYLGIPRKRYAGL